jgi:AraC family transcriptional regulator
MTTPDTAGAETGLAETIGILRQPWVRPTRSSAGHGWAGLYVSTQSEQPYRESFEPVRAHLVVLHLGGPVIVEHGSGGSRERKIVPAGGFLLHPAGHDLDVALGGALNTIHANLADAQVDQAAEGSRVELAPRLGANDPMIEQLLLAMDGVLKDPVPTARTYVDHLTAMLAAHLAHRYNVAAGSAPSTPAVAGLDGRQLGDVIDVMKLRLAEPIPLADLAAVAGLSNQSANPAVQGQHPAHAASLPGPAAAGASGARVAYRGPADRRYRRVVRVLTPGAPDTGHAGADGHHPRRGATVELIGSVHVLCKQSAWSVQDRPGPRTNTWVTT